MASVDPGDLFTFWSNKLWFGRDDNWLRCLDLPPSHPLPVGSPDEQPEEIWPHGCLPPWTVHHHLFHLEINADPSHRHWKRQLHHVGVVGKRRNERRGQSLYFLPYESSSTPRSPR